MNKPEPMTDEQIECVWIETGLDDCDPHGFAHAIIAVRDAQWEQMLAGQERAFADAARRSGLTLLKTQKGYELQDLGLITAHAAPQPAQEPDDIAAAMGAVADEFAHKLALDLECILAEYSGKWYDTAIDTLGKYRAAMREIHETISPTFMGEPLIVAPQPAQPSLARLMEAAASAASTGLVYGTSNWAAYIDAFIRNPAQEPDAYCVTTPDGACVSTDPRCMHQPAQEPVAQFEDPKVQTVYNVLCAEDAPPEGQHWEGWVARKIVDALYAAPQPAQEPETADALLELLGMAQKEIDRLTKELQAANNFNRFASAVAECTRPSQEQWTPGHIGDRQFYSQPTPNHTAMLEQALEALNAMLTHMGMDEDEWNRPTFEQARAAIAAIKEALK